MSNNQDQDRRVYLDFLQHARKGLLRYRATLNRCAALSCALSMAFWLYTAFLILVMPAAPVVWPVVCAGVELIVLVGYIFVLGFCLVEDREVESALEDLTYAINHYYKSIYKADKAAMKGVLSL